MSWGATAVAGAALAGSVISGKAADKASRRAAESADAANAINARLADISEEQWQLYKENALPMLKDLAAQRTTTDRTDEEVARASEDVKSQYALGRENLRRALETTRNPSDPGYADIMARSYNDEAGAVSRAITDARRTERARVEDTNWGRTLQAVGAYQGLPQNASTNMQGASAGYRGTAAANSSIAGMYGDRAGAAGYTAGYALTRMGQRGGGAPGGAPGGGAPSFGGDMSDPSGYGDYYNDFYNSNSFYGGDMGDVYLRDGGAVRRPSRGGIIRGPGTGTSDSIPHRAPVGSFIIPRDVVKKKGEAFFDKLLEKHGMRAGRAGDVIDGRAIRVSNGEYEVPPEVVHREGEEFFHKLLQRYHRPVLVPEDDMGHANGGAIRRRGLPRSVESAIFQSIPTRALARRG